jgi:glycolate oxidase iron-sulfur subunit
LKDIAHQFAGDAEWEPRAKKFAAAAKDFLDLATPLPGKAPAGLRVAYHPACSLQNSLKMNGFGEAVLNAAGFTLVPFGEPHLCCGSAGTYSILQPELSQSLRGRKLGNIMAANPDVIVSGNIGCLTHLAGDTPTVHLAELLDWAEGGPKPANLELPAASR